MNFLEIETAGGVRRIGPGYPAFIIAELSGNHNQNYERAIELIDAAAETGVDAVKLQTYTPDTITIDCDKEYFQVRVNPAWAGRTLYDLYKEAYTPWDWQPKLKEHAEAKGLLLFSTPFDDTAVDFLEKMDVQLYKAASFETQDLELLKKIGQTKKPVIISRGMTSLEKITHAVEVLKNAGSSQIAVLHCVSSYPATPDQMNLTTIPDISKRLDVVSGLSDHTLGTAVAIAGVSLGANIIEKHLTLRRADGGPDAGFSLEPHEMKELVESVRIVEAALGKPSYDVGQKESENYQFRRSLFVVKDMKPGDEFTRDNVRCIRPGHGLQPEELPSVLGKIAALDIKRGTPLAWNLIS